MQKIEDDIVYVGDFKQRRVMMDPFTSLKIIETILMVIWLFESWRISRESDADSMVKRGAAFTFASHAVISGLLFLHVFAVPWPLLILHVFPVVYVLLTFMVRAIVLWAAFLRTAANARENFSLNKTIVVLFNLEIWAIAGLTGWAVSILVSIQAL